MARIAVHRRPHARLAAAGQADARVREFLRSRRHSVFGLASTAVAARDPEVREFEAFSRLPAGEREKLERWHPALRYHCRLASAGRLERFRVRLDPSGRLIFLERVLRPEPARRDI